MTTEDYLAIRQLADRYTDAANRLDATGMAAVYAEEGELHAFGNVLAGRAAIEASFTPMVERFEFINQVCSAPIITVDGDRGTSRWTITEFNRRHGADKLEMFLGTYDDMLERRDGEWCYLRRTLIRKTQGRIDTLFRL